MSVVEYHTSDGIAYVKLNRPEKHNPLNRAVFDRLEDIWDDFCNDDGAHVAILFGAGENFSTGFDLGEEIGTLDEFNEEEIRRKNVDISVGGLVRGKRIRKPVIAAIEGWCLAGAFEAALACDLRVASETAKFGLYHVREGMPNADGGSVRLPLIAGLGNALELSLTGRHITAERAKEMNIVNRLAPEGRALDYAERYGELILELPQEGVRAQKETIVETVAGGNLAHLLQYEGVLAYNGLVRETVVENAQAFVGGEIDDHEQRLQSIDDTFAGL